MINILWKEFDRGGSIGRPPDSALYGVGDSSHLCGTRRSRVGLASLLVPREIHFLGPSGRIGKRDPFIREYGDAAMKVMVPIEYGSTYMDTTLGHHTLGCVGASIIGQWPVDGHGDAWGCVVVCRTSLWSRSASHRIEYMRGVTCVAMQDGHMMVQDNIAVVGGIHWCTGASCNVQW